MQEDIDTIYNWLSQNKLSMNIKKTKIMIIKSDTNKTQNTNIKITIKNETLEQVDSYRYLGITIQNNLKWDKHINIIKRKIIAMSGVVYRLGNRLNNQTLRSIYFAYIHSQLSYLAPIWGPTTAKYHITSLQISQNNAVRRIFSKNYHTDNMHTIDIYKANNILNVEQIIKIDSTLLMIKLSRNMIKSDIQIDRVGDGHHHHTRHGNNIVISNYRTNIGRNNVSNHAAIQYNIYKNNINENDKIYKIKKKLKKLIIDSQN